MHVIVTVWNMLLDDVTVLLRNTSMNKGIFQKAFIHDQSKCWIFLIRKLGLYKLYFDVQIQ